MCLKYGKARLKKKKISVEIIARCLHDDNLVIKMFLFPLEKKIIMSVVCVACVQ